MKPSRPTIEDLDPDKPITDRQYRYIKFCCADHLLRAESVARAVVGQDLSVLNQLEAHEVIQYLEKAYWEGSETAYATDFEVELGKALTRVDQRSEFITSRVRVLALLATNRVATPGQLARFVYGVHHSTFNSIRGRIAPLLERMLNDGAVGRAERIDLPMLGKGAATDVYYLTERGSDELHLVASQINYHARPGLPPVSRLQHELAVTEARLDVQRNNHLEEYLPETKIRSEQEKKRREQRRANGADTNKDDEAGCGDFQAWVVDASSNRGRKIEVEVSIRARQREIVKKPKRIKLWYASTQHRCDLIELSRGEFARLLPDVREPLTQAERHFLPERSIPRRATVSAERVSKVRDALERMGGVGTPEALAAVVGIKTTTASEALALLADKGEIDYRDGFPLSGKQKGRNCRLYKLKELNISSIFEFARLLTASKLISAGILSREYDRSLSPCCFDPATGLMTLTEGGDCLRLIVVAVLDDPVERPARVADWASVVYEQFKEGTVNGPGSVSRSAGPLSIAVGLQRKNSPGADVTMPARSQVVIATADEERATLLREANQCIVVHV
jgi:hypothetical protein